MKKLNLLFLVCFVLLSGCQLTSEYQPSKKSDHNKVYTPTEFKQDARYLLKILEDVHVSPWEKHSQADFTLQLESIIKENFWLQSRLEIYRHLAPLVAQLQENHTRLIYPESLSSEDGFSSSVFPFTLQIENKKVFVNNDLTNKFLIPVGAEITAINGINISHLLERMSRFIPAETDSGVRRQIEINFARLLTRELGVQPPFKIEWNIGYLKTTSNINQPVYQAQDNSPDTTIIDSNNLPSSVEKPDPAHWGEQLIDTDTIMLWLSDFESNPEKFSQFLANWFPTLKDRGISKLVIDLRYNVGGIGDNVLNLLSYIEEDPIKWANKINLRNSKIFRLANQERLKQIKYQKLGFSFSWLPIEYLNGWNWQLLLTGNGTLIEEEFEPLPVKPPQKRFLGKLAVLSNGYCFSGCAFFVNTIQNSQRGIIVGESPGSLVGIQFGYPVSITLPHTKLQLLVPVAKIKQSDNAYQIKLKYLVSNKSSDLAQGRDVYLDTALKELNKP